MRQLLAAHPDVDAVFAANDLMALGALTVLRTEGRRIPEDVALIGFDDIEIAQHSEPALTTIRQPVAEVAREMTREVLRQIDGLAPAGPCVLEPNLVERGTVRSGSLPSPEVDRLAARKPARQPVHFALEQSPDVPPTSRAVPTSRRACRGPAVRARPGVRS